MRSFSLCPTAALLGAALVGVSPAACDKKSDASEGPPLAAGEVRVTASEHGFTPSSLSLAKGGPGSVATVTFVRTSEQTCANEVVFPDLGIKKELPLNQVVAVNVPSDTPRTLSFQCGMGMYKGALVVR